MGWTPLHGATFGPLTTSTPLSHSCAGTQTSECNHRPLFFRELQAVISLPQLRFALYQAAAGLLSATASPWLSPTVYRCSFCAQVPLADTLGPELAVETGSQSL